MSDSNNSSSGGIGVVGALGVAFVVLKLLHKIDWSWWWVTSPFWVPFAIAIPLLVLLFVSRRIAS